MSNQPAFDGSESPADIAKAAIEWFVQKPHKSNYAIFYTNSIPMMKYELRADWLSAVCVYRLDKILESFYADAEKIFDKNVEADLVDTSARSVLVAYIAFVGMSAILQRLLILQSQIFLETIDDAELITSGIVLHSLVEQYKTDSSISRVISKQIQEWIDSSVSAVTEKKRDFLVGYMNTQPLINIPTGVGRPLGSKKSEEKKREEAAQFEKGVETVIRDYYTKHGKRPTKTAVAKALNIGGLTKEGYNTSLPIFSRKLKNLGVDYNAIVEKVIKSKT